MAEVAKRSVTLVLASSSPRRQELLRGLGLTFEIVEPRIDETLAEGESAAAGAVRLAERKAAFVAASRPEAVVLAADTVVVCAGRVLGKPSDASDARRMIERLSGRTHEVITGMCVRVGDRSQNEAVVTRVHMTRLPPETIAWYVETGEPFDKAGAYAIQGAGGALIERIEGSHSNVVGLPLVETARLLASAGLPLPWVP